MTPSRWTLKQRLIARLVIVAVGSPLGGWLCARLVPSPWHGVLGAVLGILLYLLGAWLFPYDRAPE